MAYDEIAAKNRKMSQRGQPQPKLDNLGIAQRRRDRRVKKKQKGFLRVLCASARGLGGLKMWLKNNTSQDKPCRRMNFSPLQYKPVQISTSEFK